MSASVLTEQQRSQYVAVFYEGFAAMLD
jgi:hypothetical protein